MKSRTNGKTPTKMQPPTDNTLLEAVIVETLLAPLRSTKERKRIRAKRRSSHKAVEQALLSAKVRRALENGLSAYVSEQTLPILEQIFNAARAKEAWACKVVLELARISDGLNSSRATSEAPAEELALSSAVERSIVENILSLLRGANHERNSIDLPTE
jgi:hypothetical protein